MRDIIGITKTMLAFALAFSLLPLAACEKQPLPAKAPVSTMESLVPEKANLMGLVHVTRILDDKDIPDLYRALATREPGAPPTLEAALQRMESQTGINPRDFDEAVMFGEMSSLLNAGGGSNGIPYAGVILKGRIGKDLVKNIVSQWGLKAKPVAYQGYELYVSQNDAVAVAVVAEDFIAIGSSQALKEVMDVRQGAGRPISGKVYDAFRALPDGLVRLSSTVPPELLRSIPSQKPPGIPGGELTDRLYSSMYVSIRDLDLFTLVLGKDKDRFVVDTALLFNNKGSSGNLGGPLKAAVTMGKLAPGLPKAVKILLSNMSLKTEDFLLTIQLSLTPQEIVEAATSRQ
ncbi:MAG: hypothetical protein V1737_04260 [Chloroflexota bacterium]